MKANRMKVCQLLIFSWAIVGMLLLIRNIQAANEVPSMTVPEAPKLKRLRTVLPKIFDWNTYKVS